MLNHHKARKLVFASAIAVSLLATTACTEGIASTGDSVNLEFASFLPEAHPYSEWYLDWADEVTEKTEGRVTFTNYFSGSLVAGTELAAAVSDGRIDLGQPNSNYTPERFPLSELISVPYSTPNVGAAMQAVTELYADYEPYRQEFADDGVIPLQFQPTGTNVLGSNGPITGLAELANARVRSASYFASGVQKLGANPISMPLGDVYQSMQTGLLDAWMTPMENTVQYNLGEVTTNIQDPGMGPTSLSVILMNEDRFNSLLPEDQAIVLEVSADYNSRYIDLVNGIDKATCETFADTDIVLQAWDEAEVDATREIIQQPLLDAYIADAQSFGVDATEFSEKWQEYQENYSGEFGDYVGSVQTCLASK